MIGRITERIFISHDGSCPFMRDNRCNANCVFFTDCTTVGKCGLPNTAKNSTGYFTEQEKMPYGSYC